MPVQSSVDGERIRLGRSIELAAGFDLCRIAFRVEKANRVVVTVACISQQTADACRQADP